MGRIRKHGHGGAFSAGDLTSRQAKVVDNPTITIQIDIIAS